MVANTRKMHEIKQILYSILEEEYYLCDLFNSLLEDGTMDWEHLQEFRQIAKKPLLHQEEITSLTKEEIMANPYLQNIKIPNVTTNNFTLSNKRIIRPGVLFTSDEKRRDLTTMRQINSYQLCNKALRFPGIHESNNSTCWMTVEPFEINSFKGIIEEASGNVLLFGCGLGYVAYMMSLKPEVTSITIVDNSQDVIDIFSTNILPQFENKGKIKIIKEDALEYLKNCNLSQYNYVNVDIWYDVIDMIFTYLECLEIEKENPSIRFSYWLENNLKEDVQKSLLSAICEYPTYGFLSDRIAADIVRETPINNYEDIYNLVDIKNLRNFLYDWYRRNKSVVEQYKAKDTSRMNAAHQLSTIKRRQLIP